MVTGASRYTVLGISIHAPHTRSDIKKLAPSIKAGKFQSTLLIRGATCAICQKEIYCKKFQSTLLIRGATAAASASAYKLLRFQSTLLIRGATLDGKARFRVAVISIHAPHTRSDETNLRACLSSYFNPRSSYEERQLHNRPRLRFCHFNPRSSYEERRGAFGWLSDLPWHFNPRSSYEERPSADLPLLSMMMISIHAPHTRSDVSTMLDAFFLSNFNPRSSYEERPHLSYR